MALANFSTSSHPPRRTQTNGGPSPSSRSLSSGMTHFVSSLGVRWALVYYLAHSSLPFEPQGSQ